MLRALMRVKTDIPDNEVNINRQDAIRNLSERIAISITVINVLDIGLNA
jgi:hypothetical protein